MSGAEQLAVDLVVTVPMHLWDAWIAEGDLPGDPPSGLRSHFWIRGLPAVIPERLYIVAHGRLRGFAPVVGMERVCSLTATRAGWSSAPPRRACILRDGGAAAVTIPERITGFRGHRLRWWKREDERPFPEWRTP